MNKLIDKIVKEAHWIKASVQSFDIEGDDYGAIVYNRHPRHDVYIYTPIQNIGKRGKTVTQYNISLWEKDGNIAWGATAEQGLKSIKTAEEALKYVRDLFQQAAQKEPSSQYSENKPWVLKGVDHKLPLPSHLNVYKDKKGTDVNVNFKKPYITIGSEQEDKRVIGGRQNTWLEIQWKYADKINGISDDLIKLTGFNEVGKLLSQYQIPYNSRLEMDPMYQ